MAEFTPNLDDGELWLPSDIVHDVGVRCHHPHLHYDLHRTSRNVDAVEGFRQAYDVENLARQLAAAGLLDRSTPPMSRCYPQLDRQAGVGRLSRFGKAAEPEVRPVYGRPSRRLVAGEGGLRLGMNSLEQVRAQMEMFKLEKSGGAGGGRPVAQRQAVPRPVRSRTGSGMGTGVFIPRVFNDSGCKQVKKKPQVKEEQMLLQQQQLTRNVIGLKQAMPFQAPLAEMALPPDWTY